MSAINDNNFIAIQGWMRTQLNLKGNELLIYALIYGFSQDGESKFKGSRKYIADWCGCSLNTVDRSLGSLVDKGLLAKYPHTDAYGNRLVDYVAIHPPVSAAPAPAAPAATAAATQATTQDAWADTTNATPEQFQTLPAEPQPLIEEPAVKPQPKKTRKAKSFDGIIDAYTSDPETKDLLGAWLQNRKAKHSAMTDRAIQGNIDKLDQYAQASHMSVNDYLNEVICRGWGSFFIIDNYRNNGYQQKSSRQQSQQPHWDLTEEELRRQKEADDEWLKNCVF